MAHKFIFVTFAKEGIHKYPQAKVLPNLEDVSFLGYEHRHMFHFKVWIEVFHNDRDIEFIQFKRWCEKLYNENCLSLNNRSCEMISDELYDRISAEFPKREIRIEVSEDNENGSYIEYRKL